MSNSIALFYGSSTCYTEMAAEKIQAEFAEHGIIDIPLYNIKDEPLKTAEQYDILLFGISTWDFGEIQEDWESHWQDINQVNLESKHIAIFGLGDQVGYADWYQDAVGMLFQECIQQAINPIGFTPVAGHEFAASKATTDDGEYFVGLALDDENQYDLSEQRIKDWVQQLLTEL